MPDIFTSVALHYNNMRMSRISPFKAWSPAYSRVLRLIICMSLAWGSGAAIVQAVALHFSSAGENAYVVGQIMACLLIPIFMIIGFGWRRYGLLALGIIGTLAMLACQLG